MPESKKVDFRKLPKDRVELLLPPAIALRVKREAVDSGRSISEEISRRLAKSYRMPVANA